MTTYANAIDGARVQEQLLLNLWRIVQRVRIILICERASRPAASQHERKEQSCSIELRTVLLVVLRLVQLGDLHQLDGVGAVVVAARLRARGNVQRVRELTTEGVSTTSQG